MQKVILGSVAALAIAAIGICQAQPMPPAPMQSGQPYMTPVVIQETPAMQNQEMSANVVRVISIGNQQYKVSPGVNNPKFDTSGVDLRALRVIKYNRMDCPVTLSGAQPMNGAPVYIERIALKLDMASPQPCSATVSLTNRKKA